MRVSTRSLPSCSASPASDAMRALIVRSVEIKASIVLQDEREGGIRRNLNFGHTLGHAIESESGYSLLHGEAIAIGMVLEARLGERLGVTAAGTADRLRDTFRAPGSPSRYRRSSARSIAILSAHPHATRRRARE